MVQDWRGMERWQLDTAERLASIERSIKYIEAHIGDLPQSKKCITEFEKQEARITSLESFRNYMYTRIAFVSGVAASVITAIPYLFEWLKHLGRGTS